MGKIKLDTEELQKLKSDMLSVNNKIREVSSGGYVTDHLFVESQAKSAEAMSRCLEALVKSANQMEDIVDKTASFLGEIVEGFSMTDSENATKINRNLD